MPSRLQKDYDNNISHLKDLMTAPPMSPATHARIQQQRVQARRTIENARDEALLRNDVLSDL